MFLRLYVMIPICVNLVSVVYLIMALNLHGDCCHKLFSQVLRILTGLNWQLFPNYLYCVSNVNKFDCNVKFLMYKYQHSFFSFEIVQEPMQSSLFKYSL